jgi:hypothetical protein
MEAKDIHKGDRVLTPEGQEVEVSWKKLEVILAGGRMWMAEELRPAPKTPHSSD